MFDTRFNNGYQNTVMPLNTEPYAPSGALPNMMNNNIPYPVQPSQSVPAANIPNQNTIAYADGGKVKKKKASKEKSPYPMLAEMIRQQGNGEDTVLAHINPLEAMMLKEMGGSGTINKKTGLPQFSVFSNPGKATRAFFTKPSRAIAEIVGIGSALFGGPLGGAIGGAGKEIILGRPKSALSGAASGALLGTALPAGANLLGKGLSGLGATGVGGSLQNYGTSNMGSWLGNMGQLGGGVSGLSSMFGGGAGAAGAASSGSGAASNTVASEAATKAATKAASEVATKSWTDKLMDPSNLLAAGSLAASIMGRPKEKKEKTPEQQADEHKRLQRALRLSPEDRAGMEANLLAEEQMRRRIARKKFLPEERLGDIEPLSYRKSHTPAEHKKHGKWFSYYNDPNFSSEATPYQEGGEVSPDTEDDPEQQAVVPMTREALSAIFNKPSNSFKVPFTGGRLRGWTQDQYSNFLKEVNQTEEGRAGLAAQQAERRFIGPAQRPKGLFHPQSIVGMIQKHERTAEGRPEGKQSFLTGPMKTLKKGQDDPANMEEAPTTGLLGSLMKGTEGKGSLRPMEIKEGQDDPANMEENVPSEEQMKRRISRKKFLPKGWLGDLEPLFYPQGTTPAKRKKKNKLFKHYGGEAVPYREGGEASPGMMYEAEEMQYPEGAGRYLQGETGGQDDKIKALLSDGEYVIPADAVAHLGDGNNAAGAKRLDKALKNIRKQRGGSIHKLPPKAKSLTSYLRG